MRHAMVWKIAAPMFALGGLLAALGMFAAWNVNARQASTSEMVAREVCGMMAISELHITMREIRYQVNLYLRTGNPQHLESVRSLHADARAQLERAATAIRNSSEQRLIDEVTRGYEAFFSAFDGLVPRLRDARSTATADDLRHLAMLSDQLLTDDVLRPLHESLQLNEEIVQRMDEASRESARNLTAELLVLGVCGGAAGLVLGWGISRAIGRSLVQLTVSVQGVAGRLAELRKPVTVSHRGGLPGIESSLRVMERDIAAMVERLHRSETELLRKEQLARVGQLAAGLAHELRNPLMPMKMLVQAAMDRGPGAGLQGRSLEVIESEIGRLEKSIQAFLDFARPPLPEKAPVDICELVAPTLDLISARAAGQHVEVRSVLPGEPAVTLVDRGQIRQLLLNVLLNAIEAMPTGGRVDVCIAQADLSPAAGGDEVDAPQWIILRVSDSGIGIPPHVLPEIFEPFVTTKESGTGLGLSICSRIAAAHGGRLTARNRSGGGAEVELLLPRMSG